MEQLMMYGPLQVSMHLYNDFRYYKEGNVYVEKIQNYYNDTNI